MTTSYADEDDYAIRFNYANWTAYAAGRPNAPTLANVQECLKITTEIINRYVGCFSTNVTNTSFTDYLKDLNVTMAIRMRQVDLAQGKFNSIPYFSPNDYLIDRERAYLEGTIGVITGYRKVGKSG